MKKLLTGILALTLALSFTACGKDESTNDSKNPDTPKVEDKISSTDAAKEVATSFMDAYKKFNIEEASQYVNGEISEEIAQFDIENIKKEMLKTMPEDFAPMADYLTDMLDSVVDTISSSTEYKIISAEEDGDNVKVVVDVTSPNVDNLEATFENAMAEDMEQEMLVILTEAMESGALTESSTDEEMMEYLMPKIFEIAEEMIVEELKNAETTTKNFNLILTEVDGKWLIDPEKSEI